MKRLNKAVLALATAGVLASGVAQAGLESRAGGTMLYDNVLNITWLADANYAATQFAATGGTQGDADGHMNWTAANAWADDLSYGGYEDWRLPTSLNQDGSGPCRDYNCTNSEMGHMFYNNLGASAGGSILIGTNTDNLALFTNLQSDGYWSGTAYAPYPAIFAWVFYTNYGDQDTNGQHDEFYAWAVRPGDVAAVPEPEAYALLLAGLGLLGTIARQRKNKQG